MKETETEAESSHIGAHVQMPSTLNTWPFCSFVTYHLNMSKILSLSENKYLHNHQNTTLKHLT